MNDEPLRALIETVLYEGYVLYPYGARSAKNRVRFQWGVLGPVGADAEGVVEAPRARAECVLDARPGATLTISVRFLQMQERTVERACAGGFAEVRGPEVDGGFVEASELEVDGGFVEVPELEVDGGLLLPWTEAVEHEVTIGPTPLSELLEHGHVEPISLESWQQLEPSRERDGRVVARLRRRRWSLRGHVSVTAEQTDRASMHRVAVEIDNEATWEGGGGRDQALRRSFVAAHAILHAGEATFVSSQDPPAHARAAVEACRGERLWPVLVGRPERADTMLCAPIILYDHPELAPESPGDLFDATEIDELLTLRVMTLTDDEKREARATDPRAAGIVDRADTLPPEILERLHGAARGIRPRRLDAPGSSAGTEATTDVTRRDPAVDAPGTSPTTPVDEEVTWWDPTADASVSPGTDSVEVAGVSVAAGSRVRLVPSRRADAQDLFLAGRTATVAAVVFDVDGGTHLAVTLDDDPASDLHDWYGRYRYFGPEEVEPLDEETPP